MSANEDPQDNLSDEARSERVAQALETIAKNLGSPQSISKTELSKFVIDIISTVGLWVAAGVAAWAIFSSDDDANRQRAEMISAERPWLLIQDGAVEGIVLGPAKDNSSILSNVVYGLPSDKYVIGLNLTVLNVGRSPARNLHFYGEIFPGSAKPDGDFSQDCAMTKTDKNFPGEVVFPNIPAGNQPVEATGQIEELKNVMIPGRSHSDWAYIGVCLMYRSSTTDKVYHTFKLFMIGHSRNPELTNAMRQQFSQFGSNRRNASALQLSPEALTIAPSDMSDFAD